MKTFTLLAFLCIGFLLLAKIAGDHAGDVVSLLPRFFLHVSLF